ncbi:DUF3180 domain-containing protein [Jiangella anatolica]|uniref:DUF3180 domain-containing protein n=1 Tax=Jiangella anatolica TaxID=2670374 RepID=A0A2W2C0H6_9ACTN|nr:DUF3180 domain-containing protein [Jiangella anatolica]PZF81809.1 hypothetical protein C1I92_19470 [Jiangella anatolica]
MQRTRIGSLIWVALVAVPVGWSIGRVVDAMSDVLPPIPWVLPALLLFLAIAMFAGARAVRGWIHERRFDTRIDALRVARSVALAKASEYFGAVLVGVYTGLGLLAVGRLDSPMGRNRAILSAVVIVAAVVLTIAAVRLERAGEVPPPSDDENGGAHPA